jgi:hypothetical protein
VIQCIATNSTLNKIFAQSELGSIIQKLNTKEFSVISFNLLNYNHRDPLFFFRSEFDKISDKSEFLFSFEEECKCKTSLSMDPVNVVEIKDFSNFSKVFQQEISEKYCGTCRSTISIKTITYPKTSIFCLRSKSEHKILIGNKEEIDNLNLGNDNYRIISLIYQNENHFYSVVREGSSWFKIDDEFSEKISQDSILNENILMIFLKKNKEMVKIPLFLVYFSNF